MNEEVWDKYNTVLGMVKAARVTDTNMDSVAKWCDGEIVKHPEPYFEGPAFHVKLRTVDQHQRFSIDTADVDEWVVLYEEDAHFEVQADGVFLSRIIDKEKSNVVSTQQLRQMDQEQIAKILHQLLEFHEHVVSRGGVLSESCGAVEFAAMQIENLYR